MQEFRAGCVKCYATESAVCGGWICGAGRLRFAGLCQCACCSSICASAHHIGLTYPSEQFCYVILLCAVLVLTTLNCTCPALKGCLDVCVLAQCFVCAGNTLHLKHRAVQHKGNYLLVKHFHWDEVGWMNKYAIGGFCEGFHCHHMVPGTTVTAWISLFKLPRFSTKQLPFSFGCVLLAPERLARNDKVSQRIITPHVLLTCDLCCYVLARKDELLFHSVHLIPAPCVPSDPFSLARYLVWR